VIRVEKSGGPILDLLDFFDLGIDL